MDFFVHPFRRRNCASPDNKLLRELTELAMGWPGAVFEPVTILQCSLVHYQWAISLPTWETWRAWNIQNMKLTIEMNLP
jgi:hypothetical protein